MAASCHLRLQRIEALAPLPVQVAQPALYAVKRCAIKGVEPAGAFRANVGEAALAQHTQLARDSRLRKPELRLHDIDDVAGAALAGRQQLENAPPHRIAQDVEGLHIVT